MVAITKMGTRRAPRLLALGVGLALVATACSGNGSGGGSDGENDSEATPAVATGEPVAGGDLRIVVSGGMATWDPGSASGSFPGNTFDRLYAVYGALFTVDVEGHVQPGLAESFETSDGGATWTLEVRPDVTFSDGEIFDAAAVKYNWDRIAESELAGSAVAGLFTSEVVDDLTLEVTPTEPDPMLDLRIAESIPFIASPASLEAQGEDFLDPVGAGPFLLESTDPGVGDSLTANPEYWEEGKPYVDTLTFAVITDPAQRIQTVVQGGANVMNGYPFQFGAEAENPAVSTFGVDSGGIRHFVFNTAAEPFDDVRARRAVALAVDPTELMQTLTQDPGAESSTTLFPESSAYFDDSLALPTGDLEEAQALVDELVADGVSLDVKISVPVAPENVRVAEYLQLAIEQLEGFDVEVQQVPLPDYRTTVLEGDDFSITPYPGVFDLASPRLAMANLFGPGGTDNFANLDDPDMNSALEAARDALEPDAQDAAFRTIQELYLDLAPIVVFGQDQRAFLHSADMAGFETMGRGTLHFEELHFVGEG